MNDRCRVFALNGEELFPCRWAKAKKLVAANVAKKATIDGKMCIKMLEPTRMNKPQEAIMNNEIKNEVSFVFPEKLFKFCALESRLLSGFSRIMLIGFRSVGIRHYQKVLSKNSRVKFVGRIFLTLAKR